MEKEFNSKFIDGDDPKWYEQYPKGKEACKHSKSATEVADLKAEAKKCLDGETALYQMKESKSRDSETAWLKTVLTTGTTSDKIAAAIVLIQKDSKHTLAKLVMLVNQVKVAKHNQCNMVITSLKELFLNNLLHPQFKLLKFEEQNLNILDETISTNSVIKSDTEKKRLLAHWYFEDQIHELYERFVTSLSNIASDTVDSNREAAVQVMTDLLIGNAEQEHKLLEMLVNKIGDPSCKVASTVIFCLNKLLYEHPNMKLVLLKEVEKLLFRKNVAPRAQYYGICLLTQFILSKKDEEIASTLVEVYFAFFRACLKKGEPNSKMMGAILTGVNRAYPFAKIDSSVMSNHIDSVYKVVHVGTFNVSLNALNLLFQVTGNNETQSERFYNIFYRKLLDPQIGVANKRAVFLNLLFRVLQRDHKIERLYSIVKRILQISLYFPPNMACATLYVVSKILQIHKALKNLILKPNIHIKIEKEDSEFEDGSLHSGDNNEHEECIVQSEESILLPNVTIGPSTNKEEQKPEIKVEDGVNIEPNKQVEYNPFARNPLYAGITKALSTELLILAKHNHPSVALFANTILEGKPINYTGDPLEDLSLMRFLDRYVFKNPKKVEDKKVQKKNDPLAQRAGYTPKGIRSTPVDSASYLNEREERIPVDELFLYRYMKKKTQFKHDTTTEDDDLESVNSEEFNDMLDRLGSGQDFEDFDIAADIQTRKTKKKDTEENDDDLEVGSVKSEGSEDINDENMPETADIDGDDDIDNEWQDLNDMDVDIDDDASDIEFNEDEDDDEDIFDSIEPNVQNKTKTKYEGKNKKKMSKGIDNNIFVSAEKFAEMLEEHGKQKNKHGGANALNTADGASSKQIDWEIKRHQKLRGLPNRNKRKDSKISRKHIKKIKRRIK